MALSAARDTKRKGNVIESYSFPVAATTTIFQGALVELDATGFLTPAGTAVAAMVQGRAVPLDNSVDNSAGADGDEVCEVDAGTFKWTNSSGAACTQAHVGQIVFAEDDETIRNDDDTGSKPEAGVMVELDADGDVWVKSAPEISATA